jgi:hypothetical protein
LFLLWTLAAHGVAAAAVFALAIAWPAKALLLAAAVLHARIRRPQWPALLVRDRDGVWALPDRGLTGLIVAPGSRFCQWWVYLVLSDGRSFRRVLLLRDQFDSETWRRLQAALRC